MVRNIIKKDEVPEAEPISPAANIPQVQIREMEINLSLINDKINYMTSLLHKIAEACEINFSN